MTKWELVAGDAGMVGKQIVFVHADGTPATHGVGIHGEDADGNVRFFEIREAVTPTFNGKKKFKRLIVQRVFPCLMDDVKEEST